MAGNDPQPGRITFSASRLDLGHTLRMVKLGQEAIVLAKGTRGAAALGPEVNNALDAIAAATATIIDTIGQRLDP